MKWTESEKHNLPKLTQNETENLNSSISIKNIQFILLVKTISTKKTAGLGGFTGVFYQTFMEWIELILHKLF